MTSVFTCGVFDLFHYGHLDFLLRAADLGDRLIVGVNSDEYVLGKKHRPALYPLRERMRILSALECVDEVVPFWEDDPCELIRRLKPDVVAKGSEYSHANAPEAALIESLGGRFVTLESLPIHASDILAKLIPSPAETQRQIDAAKAKAREVPAPEPCVYRGPEIEQLDCKPCQNSFGLLSVPVFECSHPQRKHHPKCVLNNVGVSGSDGLRPLACSTCRVRKES